MRLKPVQADHYYRQLYSLLDFTNKRLEVLDHGFLEGGDELYDQDMGALLKALWSDRSLIEEFVRMNPAKLSRSELNSVMDWRHALTGPFVLVAHEGGYSYFMADDKAYAVLGLTEEMSGMLPQTPLGVDTALLPFDGAIVYDAQIREYPMRYTQNATDMVTEAFQSLKDKGEVYKSAQALIRNAPYHEEERHQRELDRKIDAYQREKRRSDPAGNMPEGFFLGRLAGLGPDEREAAIQRGVDEEMAEPMSPSSLSMVEVRRQLAGYVREGQPSRDLDYAFNRASKGSLEEQARPFGIKYRHKMRKAELIQAMKAEPDFFRLTVEAFLSYAPERMLEPCAQLVEAGGRLDIRLEDYGLGLLFPNDPPFIYLVRYGDTISALMPEQFRQAYLDADKDEAMAFRQEQRSILSLANACVELYGMIPLAEYEELLLELHPQMRTPQSPILESLYSLSDTLEASFQLWMDYEAAREIISEASTEALKAVFYLVHYDLSNRSLYSEYNPEPEQEDFDNLAEWRRHLMSRHLEIPRRPLPAGLLAGQDYLDYCRTLEPVQALVRFFDTYVPNDADDLFFADELVDTLLLDMRLELGLQGCLREVEAAGFYSSPELLEECLQLLTAAMNAIPLWSNHGHSPDELRQYRAEGANN